MNDRDTELLTAAIDLARAAVRAGELPYGSLLADADGTVVARDHNTVASTGDITAHPELKLARLAAATYPVTTRATLTMYTSCEPCAMCTEVIARAGLRRVVFALSTEQLRTLRPPADPSSGVVPFDGPALHDLAADPIRLYYGRR